MILHTLTPSQSTWLPSVTVTLPNSPLSSPSRGALKKIKKKIIWHYLTLNWQLRVSLWQDAVFQSSTLIALWLISWSWLEDHLKRWTDKHIELWHLEFLSEPIMKIPGSIGDHSCRIQGLHHPPCAPSARYWLCQCLRLWSSCWIDIRELVWYCLCLSALWWSPLRRGQRRNQRRRSAPAEFFQTRLGHIH